MRISVAMKKTFTRHKVNAATPRLSDEELDPIEQDDSDGISVELVEAYLPWNAEDVLDIRRLISKKLPIKECEILLAFLEGLTHADVGVTEKYWRYHFNKGVEFIKKELKL